jgi:hypothetical protein
MERIEIIGKKQFIPHDCPVCKKQQYYLGDNASFVYAYGKYYCKKCYKMR